MPLKYLKYIYILFPNAFSKKMGIVDNYDSLSPVIDNCVKQ